MAPDSSIGDALDEAHAVVTTGGGTGVARVVAVASIASRTAGVIVDFVAKPASLVR